MSIHITLAVFVVALDVEAAKHGGAWADERNTLGGFFGDVGWGLVVHIHHDINKALVITNDSRGLLILIILPVGTEILSVVIIEIYLINFCIASCEHRQSGRHYLESTNNLVGQT